MKVLFLEKFDPWIWDHYSMSKRRAPVKCTHWLVSLRGERRPQTSLLQKPRNSFNLVLFCASMPSI